MPMLGWTADASYANVPQGMSLSMNNVIPNDQYQGRTRLSTRSSLQFADWMGTGSGSIEGGSDYPIQSVVVPDCGFQSLGSSSADRNQISSEPLTPALASRAPILTNRLPV